MSHTFLDKAIRHQLPTILEYIDALVDELREKAASNNPVADLERWYSWTNFDLTGCLTFGESFGCLSNRSDNDFNLMISQKA